MSVRCKFLINYHCTQWLVDMIFFSLETSEIISITYKCCIHSVMLYWISSSVFLTAPSNKTWVRIPAKRYLLWSKWCFILLEKGASGWILITPVWHSIQPGTACENNKKIHWQVVRFWDRQATSRSRRISRNRSSLQPCNHELHQALHRPRAVHQRAQIPPQGSEPAALSFQRPQLEAVSARKWFCLICHANVIRGTTLQ